MQIVVLDYPKDCDSPSHWEALEAWGSVTRFSQTSLPQLLERARPADVLITRHFPFRREVLDYLTRPWIILVPSGQREDLVELPIARQLGIAIVGFEENDPPCGWIRSAAQALSKANSLTKSSDFP